MKPRHEAFFKQGLFVLCQRLHESYTGSGDPLLPDAEMEIRVYLMGRLNSWSESTLSPHYDRCVYKFVLAALGERATGGL